MALKILLLVFCLFLPIVGQGISPNVIINEVAWMGTKNSANDEWIELRNNTQSSLNLEGWVLRADDKTPEINLTGTIPAQGFYLLERTDDNTVPGVPADLIYTGVLENSGENLKIYDDSGNLVDEVNCDSGWFAGNNETKQTMERTDSENWQDSQNSGGTPKAEKETAGVESLQTEIKSVTYPSGIVFSEILPSPEGPDDKEEWIELFNENSFEVSLSGWKVKDTAGRITTFTLPEGIKISGKGYLVLLRPETRITLNNTGDGLKFLQPNGEITDSITYEKAPFGQSYNRTQSGWVWSTALTPGRENIVPKKEKRLLPAEEMEAGPLTSESSVKKGTAAIGEKLPKPSNYPISLLIALTIAIFSAIVILILKRSFKISDK